MTGSRFKCVLYFVCLKWFGATANWMFLYKCNQWPNTFRYPEKYENTYQYFWYFSTFQPAFSLWNWKYLSTFSAEQRQNLGGDESFLLLFCGLVDCWMINLFEHTNDTDNWTMFNVNIINVNRSVNKVSSTAGLNSQREGFWCAMSFVISTFLK